VQGGFTYGVPSLEARFTAMNVEGFSSWRSAGIITGHDSAYTKWGILFYKSYQY
jgi:hypothetical protein